VEIVVQDYLADAKEKLPVMVHLVAQVVLHFMKKV
jgi:hypothetical protein